MFVDFYQSPLGILQIQTNHTHVLHVDFVEKESLQAFSGTLGKNCQKQLEEYFSGKRTHFDLPLFCEGTDFQKEVWQALTVIPFGKTASYKDIAQCIGNVKATRAAGQAINRNPIGIMIPCHRVIGSDGSLTGYADGLWRKKWLLKHEKIG